MIGIFLNLLDTQAEKEKFTRLYNTYKDLMYWIAFHKTGNTEDSEECVQETFFYVAQHFEKIEEVESKRTKGYLSSIVTGFAIDIYNSSKKASAISIDDENIDDSAYYEAFEKSELLSVFEQELDEESRIYFYLKYIYHYKSREIAEIYNVSDAYIRKKLQYAKAKLRKQLEERK